MLAIIKKYCLRWLAICNEMIVSETFGVITVEYITHCASVISMFRISLFHINNSSLFSLTVACPTRQHGGQRVRLAGFYGR